MCKKILIVGGFNKSISLIQKLLKNKYDITIVNKSYEDCQSLAKIEKINVIYGDGTKPYVLNDACIDEMDIVIALTPYDEDNFFICRLCKKEFKTKKTICLLKDANKKNFFYKMGIDVVISAISLITNVIEQKTFMNEISKSIPLDNDKIKITEIIVPKDAFVINRKIMEIHLPKGLIISCILRSDEIIIPNGDTIIYEDDVLIIVSTNTVNSFEEFTKKGF